MRRLIVAFSIAIILFLSVLSCTPTSQSPAYTPPPAPSAPTPAPIPTPKLEPTPTPAPLPRPAPTPTPKLEPSQENTPVDQSLVEFTQFKRLPFDIENVSAVSPIGGFEGIHTRSNPSLVRPYGQERHIIWPKMPGKPYNVYAPATTYIFMVWKSMSGQFGLNFKMYGDYRGSCFRFDHIHILNPELESEITSQLGESWGDPQSWLYLPNPILVHEGDILGQTGIHAAPINWDWMVEDRTWHEGVIAPEHYLTSFVYVRSVYDLCTDELKQQLHSLARKPGETQKGEALERLLGSSFDCQKINVSDYISLDIEQDDGDMY